MLPQSTIIQAKIRAVIPSPARSILTACYQVLPADVVTNAARKISRLSEIIAVLSSENNLDHSKLIKLLADHLGIACIYDPAIPSRSLIQHTGKSSEQLRSLELLPIPLPSSPKGYGLLAADPFLSTLKEFRRKKVPVLLGSREKILRAWDAYEAIEVPLSRHFDHPVHRLPKNIEFVIAKIINDCSRLGAREVFLGHPEPSKYECFARNDIYTGSVHPDVFQKTLDAINNSGNLLLEIDGLTQSPLSVSRTRSFDGVVVCITWNSRLEEDSILDNQIPANQFSTTPPTAPIASLDCPTPTPTLSLVRPQPKADEFPNLLMLIDDDERFSALLKSILEGKGYQVERYPNGAQALAAVQSKHIRPAAIVCDLHMPELDGKGFVAHLRKSGFMFPVLMLTSEEDRLLEAELALLGADAYVQKREDPRVLLAWIKNLTARQNRSIEA